MKWTEILRAPVIPADEKRTKQITFQTTENYLILDIWRGGNNTCRHAINLKTWGVRHIFPGYRHKAGNKYQQLYR